MSKILFRLVMIAAAACVGCAQKKSAVSRFENAPVIVISIDTLRADHLPAYGYHALATPAIDALAKDASLFENAYSACPMTLPSHLTILTGLLPPEHGVRDNVGFAFDPVHFSSLPKVLHDHGFATGAAVSSYVIRGETGLAALFDSYDDAIDPRQGAAFREYQRSGDLTVGTAERWISAHRASPYFFFLHLYEPHAPYEPIEPFRTRYATSPYDGEIATADSFVGSFLEFLKRNGDYDRAIIILTSDHGEGLDDHGEEQHSILVYRETLHVPLVVKLPRSEQPARRFATPVSLADIMPTVLELTGITFNPPPHSRSLFSSPRADRDLYAESYYGYLHFGWSELRSLISGSYQAIRSESAVELYDMDRDPREQVDVSRSQRATVSRFRTLLASYPAATVHPEQVDPEAARKLAAIGYIGSASRADATGPLPSPRDRIGDVSRIGAALRLAAGGHDQEAVEELLTLTKENPRMSEAWIQLAQLYQQQRRLPDALASYQKALACSSELSDEVAFGMGDVYLQMGKVQAAEDLIKPLLKRSPRRAATLLARIAMEKGNYDEAERLASAPGLAQNPSDLLLQSAIRVRKRDFAGASSLLEQARRLAAERGTAPVYKLDYLQGEILAQTNHPREALQSFQAETQHFPSDTMAWSHMAVLEFMTGNKPAADATLEEMVNKNPTRQTCLLAASTEESLEDLRSAQRWRVRAAKLP